MDSLPEVAGAGPHAVLAGFRLDFHACLTARADELCELPDAVLCADGPVRSLAGLSLSLAPEHRRGRPPDAGGNASQPGSQPRRPRGGAREAIASRKVAWRAQSGPAQARRIPRQTMTGVRYGRGV